MNPLTVGQRQRPAVVARRPSQPNCGMARVEVETSQDNMKDLRVGRKMTPISSAGSWARLRLHYELVSWF